MDNCIHGLFFYQQSILKDEKGYYHIWTCAKCGKDFKNRNLDTQIRDLNLE